MAKGILSSAKAQSMGALCASSNLRRAARVVTRHYDRALRRTGVTATQLPILAAIRIGSGGSIAELAHTLELERSGLSRDVSVLNRKGFVRLRAGRDKRVQQLELTARGQRVLARAYRAWVAAHAALQSRLQPNELETHMKQLRRVARAVKSLSLR
jgi:DNA-binding MarR family transcriptional regulator